MGLRGLNVQRGCVQKFICRDEVQGARSAATGKYFGYVRIASTAQRRNSPGRWIYGCTQKKGPVLRLALKGSLNLEVSKGPEETTIWGLFV